MAKDAEKKIEKRVKSVLNALWDELDEEHGKTAHTTRQRQDSIEILSESFMKEKFFS